MSTTNLQNNTVETPNNGYFQIDENLTIPVESASSQIKKKTTNKKRFCYNSQIMVWVLNNLNLQVFFKINYHRVFNALKLSVVF